MDRPATNTDLDKAVADLGRHFNESVGNLKKEIDQQFTEVNAKLDALLEMTAVRKELRALVHQLRAKGIELDENKIFVA